MSRRTVKGMVCAALAAALAAPAGAATILTAVADAYVRGGSYGNTNYGSATTLDAKYDAGTATTNSRKVYARFDLSGLTDSVTSATFALTIAAAGLGSDPANTVWTFEVYGLKDDFAPSGSELGRNWAENAITWNNAPANVTSHGANVDAADVYGGTYLDTFAVTGRGTVNGVYPIAGGAGSPLVDFINSDTDDTVTFIVVRRTQGTAAATAGQQFAPHDNATYAGPRLTLTPEPATLGLTGLGLAAALLRRGRKRGGA